MNNSRISCILICATFALVVSCGKKEEAAPPATSEAPKSVTPAVAEAQKPVEIKAPPVALPVAPPAQPAAAAQPQSGAAQATDMAKGAIEKAQAFMADKKYADAISSLQSLAGQSLTTENKTLADSLIKQAQQAMAAARRKRSQRPCNRRPPRKSKA
ncbi:MAG: hypothetical protein NTY01_00540 [Verrucomicrobia bacterium]|nr:hypothetical protein [Verrucomicrobiota bacterium]